VLLFTQLGFGRSYWLLPLLAPAPAAEKARDWQDGKVLDTPNDQAITRGPVGSSSTTGNGQVNNGGYGTYQGQTTSTHHAVYRVYETFMIEGKTHVYVAQQRLKWKWSKPAMLTVNGPVKFAVDKRRLFVIDDEGKEYEMSIVKRVLKTDASQQ
jgi:hypothetical protein